MSTPPLRFFGDRTPPLLPHEIAGRRPVLGTGERPAEMEALAARRSLHVRSPEAPRVGVEPVDGADGSWRVTVPGEPDAVPPELCGRSGERRAVADYLAEIDPAVDVHGYRPEWMDDLPLPRELPPEPSAPMRRLDRRRLVRPFGSTRFPPEERRVYQDAAFPWGSVAKLFSSDAPNGGGTAALVGPRLAVTAGHLIPRGNPWWIRIVPDYFDGTSLHGSGVESYVSDWRGWPDGTVTGYDWAILRLMQPLGSWVGYFGFNGYDDDWEDEPRFTHAGYPRAITNQRPSYQAGVSFFDDDSDDHGGQELETRADMSPGNSGGPVWGRWGDDRRLVGVVSGEEYDSAFPSGEWGNVVAGGSGFTNLVAWGRTNWP